MQARILLFLDIIVNSGLSKKQLISLMISYIRHITYALFSDKIIKISIKLDNIHYICYLHVMIFL